MAANTDPRLQNQVIYSIYVRNHTSEGTFRAVIPDLDRIRALGTDIIWLMPIHPIGVEGKKGTLGCPYANRDYRAVNPAYGTMEDFEALVREIHAHGMKCMIDVVYNHTASVEHSNFNLTVPGYFYRHNADGSYSDASGCGNETASERAMVRHYIVESVKFWAKEYHIDGFRFDLMGIHDIETMNRIREELSKIDPTIFILSLIHI